MDTIKFLAEKGLISDDYKPLPLADEVKIVKNGVIFQQFCRNGLRYDIAISWLQKAIRRGLRDQALYCAYHIADLGSIFISHLLNRLITVMSEDIGPAEPDMVKYLSELYMYTYANYDDIDEVHETLIEIITILSKARKSRVTDVLVYKVKDKEPVVDLDELPETIEEIMKWAVYLSFNSIKSDESITLSYVIGKKKLTKVKKLNVYYIWQMLFDRAKDEIQYSDIVSLFNLYEFRGARDGVLHLAHAIALVYLPLKEVDPSINDTEIDFVWQDIAEYEFPIMNQSVDMHTLWGRKHLGRTMKDFLLHGAKLVNWTPFVKEQECLDELMDKFVLKEDQKEIHPREYQKKILDTAKKYYTTKDSGWLLMACGTGKTYQSYWITEEQLSTKDEYLVVFVAPLLEIIRQSFISWSKLNKQYKKDTVSGIYSSSTDTFSKDKYSNYENITLDTLDTFLGYDAKHKFIFTTYASVASLIGIINPTFVIYDEAHHVNARHIFKDVKKLYLTATPNGINRNEIIAKYSMGKAILDGNLANYSIKVFDCGGDNFDLDISLECVNQISAVNKKIIVYSKTNIRARELFDLFNEQEKDDDDDFEIESFYVNCKTPKKDREKMYKKYRSVERAIIFNCAILGEGVDFAECDCVYMETGYSTEKRVIQATGRALRVSGDKVSTIYMMDDGKVDTRINYIRIHDPHVEDKIEYIDL